jgi:hypothetical protein
MNARTTRCGLCLALAFALLPLLAGRAQSPKAADKNQTLRGSVVSLDKLLAKEDVRLDPDAAPTWLALRADDGKVYPLVKDAGSRMFFKDARLLNRPMRLTARPVAGGALLQVVGVQSYVKGALCDVYYWCDICAIRTNELGICDCCGGPTELREVPVKE